MKTLPVYLRLLKASATALFWVTVLLLSLITFFVVEGVKLGGSPFFTINLPNVTLNDVPAKVVNETGRQVSFSNTAQTKISFSYPDPVRFREDLNQYTGQFMLPMISAFALVLIGLWQVKRIFDTLGTPAVFSRANVTRIRVIACLLIVYQLLPGIVWLFIQSDITALLDTYKIRYSINQDTRMGDIFITGVLLFGLAEVFRSGLRLKQDQDLTI